jgi:O-antigen ligase
MAHNDFLRLGYEIGIPGAISLLALFLYVLFHCFGRLKNAIFPQERDRLSLCQGLVAGLLTCAMAVNTLRSTVIIFYYLVVMGALLWQRRYSWELDEDIDG